LCGFSLPALRTPCTSVCPLPAAFASLRTLHLVEPSGGGARARASMAARSSGPTAFGRPLPGLSFRPSRPPSANLLLHRLTTARVTPALEAMSGRVRPSALSSTIFALLAMRCSVRPDDARALSAALSSSDTCIFVLAPICASAIEI